MRLLLLVVLLGLASCENHPKPVDCAQAKTLADFEQCEWDNIQ